MNNQSYVQWLWTMFSISSRFKLWVKFASLRTSTHLSSTEALQPGRGLMSDAVKGGPVFWLFKLAPEIPTTQFSSAKSWKRPFHLREEPLRAQDSGKAHTYSTFPPFSTHWAEDVTVCRRSEDRRGVWFHRVHILTWISARPDLQKRGARRRTAQTLQPVDLRWTSLLLHHEHQQVCFSQ